MKRFAAFACALAFFCCTGLAACGSGNEQSVFSFLSVRMRGNGDGTITAVAQNEFSLLPAVLPVMLTLYISPDRQTDPARMTEIDNIECDDLNIFGSIELTLEIRNDGYYLAEVTFELNGKTRYIRSDTIRYDIDGNRIV